MKTKNTPSRGHIARFLALEGLLAVLLWLVPVGAQAQAIQSWVRLSDPTPDIWPRVGLALDASGNVVVSGPYREDVDSGMDWLTTKYSSTGVPLWTNRYDGPVWWDEPRAIAVDPSGNVVVTGSSARGNPPYGNQDFATIRYSGAGVPLWTNYYNGPVSGFDQAYGIAVDTNGNVYVTGRSEFGSYIDPDTGPWTTNDCVTIKYSSAGVPLWTNRYYRPGTTKTVPPPWPWTARQSRRVATISAFCVPNFGSSRVRVPAIDPGVKTFPKNPRATRPGRSL